MAPKPKRVSPDQFKLFMTARELREQYDPNWGDFEDDETSEDVWNRKLRESKETGLHKDIEDIGVRMPVTVSDNPATDSEFKPEILGGHHRVASAFEINPDMLIPVHYGDDTESARSVERERVTSDPVLQEHVKKKYGGFGQPGANFKTPNAW